MTEAEKQQDLKKLQDAIYMDKVRRARAMTPEERLEDVFELTNEVMGRMLAGVMWQKNIDSLEEAGDVLACQIDRLRLVRDHEKSTFTRKAQ